MTYALDTVNESLPAFVVLRDPEGYPTCGKMNWSSGWLPALYQGVEFSSSGTPVRDLNPTLPPPPGAQREQLDTLASLNRMHQSRHVGDSELEARIQNYELAARMQLAAIDVLDVSNESEATKKLYGLDDPVTAGYGLRCLMARRYLPLAFLETFDAPVIQTNCTRRVNSVSPLQSLALMNNDVVRESARAFAARVEKLAEGKPAEAKIETAYRLALSRPPSTAEAQVARSHLERQNELFLKSNAPAEQARKAALESFCHLLFLTNEFLYIE